MTHITIVDEKNSNNSQEVELLEYAKEIKQKNDYIRPTREQIDRIKQDSAFIMSMFARLNP